MRKVGPPKVAIICPLSVPWIARCVDGIRQYSSEHGGWHLFSAPLTAQGTGESQLTLRDMRGWKGDAIIAVSNDESELRLAKQMGTPVVNLAGGLTESHGVPRVMVDHLHAGRLAADHFLKRGLRNLAFFGWRDLWYSDQRRMGFVKRAAEEGVKTEALLQAAGDASRKSWMERISEPVEWLKSLPLPCGIFAVHDYRAQMVVEACQEAGLRIPEDIAVIGMDNDVTICEHSVPTLTSVSRNSERVGWEAAALLNRMMHGASEPPETIFLEPEGIVARQSTDMLYCVDPLVRGALEYMRENLEGSFNITAIAEHLGVSKRTLETRFKTYAGRSPHTYLTELRVQRAVALIQRPGKRTLDQIAAECGLGTSNTFYSAFRRVTGESPASFRKAGIRNH